MPHHVAYFEANAKPKLIYYGVDDNGEHDPAAQLTVTSNIAAKRKQAEGYLLLFDECNRADDMRNEQPNMPGGDNIIRVVNEFNKGTFEPGFGCFRQYCPMRMVVEMSRDLLLKPCLV